jgi:hypothetical protein
MENHNFLIGNPSVNGQFSMAILNNQNIYRMSESALGNGKV